MKLDRTPENDCLLCLKRKATVTNSHFISRGLVESIFGKRDKEEIYSIKPSENIPLQTHYGRSNLKNSNSEVSDSEQSTDFIFCPNCEKNFSLIENQCLPILTKEVREVKYNSKFKTEAINNSTIKLLIFPNKVQNELRAFVISNIWRYCILWRFKLGYDIINVREVENLRRELLMGFAEDNLEFSPVNIRCLTSLDIYDKTSDTVFYNPESINPYLMFFGMWIIFFDFQNSNVDWKKSFKEYEVLIPKELNCSLNEFKAGIISLDVRNILYKEIHFLIAEQTVKPRILALASKLNISPMEARDLLNSEAEKVINESNIEFSSAFIEAFNKLIS